MIGPSDAYHWTKSGMIPSTARRSRWRSMARKIIRRSQQLNTLADDELTAAGRKLRWEAKAGTALDKLLPEAYALVRQSARRTLKMEHFEVQIMGAIA